MPHWLAPLPHPAQPPRPAQDARDRLDRAHREHARLNLPPATLLCLLLHGLPVASKGWEDNDGLLQLRRQQLVEGDQPPFRLSMGA